MLKQGHRSHKKANEIPTSATFNPKKGRVPANATFNKGSKRKT